MNEQHFQKELRKLVNDFALTCPGIFGPLIT